MAEFGGRSFRKTALCREKDLGAHKKSLRAPSIQDYSLSLCASQIFCYLLLLQIAYSLFSSLYFLPWKGRQKVREKGKKSQICGLRYRKFIVSFAERQKEGIEEDY